MSTKPKPYLLYFGEEWDLVSALYNEARDQTFHQNVFFKVLRSKEPMGYSIENALQRIDKLIKVGVFYNAPKSATEYEFDDLSLTILEKFFDDQKLSLHAELVVRIQALGDMIKKIEKSIENYDLIVFNTTCNEMDRLLRKIKNQTLESQNAIFKLVEEAKLFPKEMPLKKRYAKTIDAWTEFVEPVINMCNPNDPFSQLLSMIENSLSLWISDPTILALSLESDRNKLELIRIRIIDFQDTLTSSAELMKKTILPIVKMIRLNSHITKGATIGLKLLSANRPSGQFLADNGIGLAKRPSKPKLGTDYWIESFLMKVLDFSEKPDEAPKISQKDLDVVSGNREGRSRLREHEIVAFMKAELPSSDVYQKTIEKFPDISLKMMLTAIAKVSRTPGYKLIRDDSQIVTIERDEKLITFSSRNIVKVNP